MVTRSSWPLPIRDKHSAGLIARVLAIPTKRCRHSEVSYLTRPELEALVAAPDRDTWTGRRDHALLDVAAVTGMRVSELTGLRNQDVELGAGAHVFYPVWVDGRTTAIAPTRIDNTDIFTNMTP